MTTVYAYAIMFLSLLFLPVVAQSQESQIEVTDMAGRIVKAPVNPERIICLGPGTLRQIVYLGRQDKVVGIENFEKVSPLGRPYLLANPQLKQLPTVAAGGPGNINNEPDLEATLKVKPDVIFISYMDPGKASTLQEKLGIPVVILSQGRFAGFDEKFHDSLRLAGKILGTEERAEAIVKFINDSKEDFGKRVGENEKKPGPTVYVGGIGFRGQQGIESTDADYTPFEWLKANNVVKSLNKKEHLFVNKEQLLAWNPDIIFIDGGGLIPTTQDFQKNPEFYNTLDAFRKSKAYTVFPFNFYVVNVDTAIADAYAIGKILYPDKFADIDVKAEAGRIYSFFVGRDVYDIMEKDFGPLTGNRPFKKE
jgi:iron complex transport system substrate-binding protein